MKTNYVRLVVTYLLILALPIQGIAQGRIVMNDAIQVVAMTETAASNPASIDSHCAKHLQNRPSSAVGFDNPAHQTVDDDSGKLSCSQMAPCCAGVAMISNALKFPLSLLTPIEFLVFVSQYPSALLDRLDRPPRFFLA
jgi:hypothetical protein